MPMSDTEKTKETPLLAEEEARIADAGASASGREAGGSAADMADNADIAEATGEFDHPADIAEHLETLPFEKQVSLLTALPAEEAAEALTELDEHVRVDILEKMDPALAATLVGSMSPDDAADMLDELEEGHRDELLNSLDHEDAEEIRSLMAYDPDTAGGLMNTEVVILDEGFTVDQAISKIRADIEDTEIPYYAYIVNGEHCLTGVLSLRDLILSRPGTRLSDSVKGQNVISVGAWEKREEIARIMGHYNFMALPVVDEAGRFLGVVTHDDVFDIIQEIATEDMLGMVGAGQDETIDTPWLVSVTKRLPWLLVNMINSALSAAVVYLFDGTIAEMAILAVFMPMVANQAGNTGQQALAVMIRQLATEKFEAVRAWKAVLREGKIGLLNGVIVGFLVWIGIYLFTDSPALATVMVVALMADMLLGALAGASIPLILKWLKRDPAQASSIFLTAITDGAGFFIFLGLATIFLLG